MEDDQNEHQENIMKVSFNIHLVLTLCCLFFFNNANAYRGGGDFTCRRPMKITIVCDGSAYNSCRNNSIQNINQYNAQVANLKAELGTVDERILNCKNEIITLMDNEIKEACELSYLKGKNEAQKITKALLSEYQKLQDAFFLTMEAPVDRGNDRAKSQIEITFHLKNLIEGQIKAIDSIINDLNIQLPLIKDDDEKEKVEIDIQTLKALKIPLRKINFDYQTEVDLDANLKGKMQEVKTNLSLLSARFDSEYTLGQQKFFQSDSNFKEASSRKTKKENECNEINERKGQLPALIQEAIAGFLQKNALLDGCNQYCHKVYTDPCP